MRAGSFGSIAPSHAFSGGVFGRAGTGMGYGGHFGNGYGGYGNRYGSYFGRGGYGGYGGWGWGGYGPWYGGWGVGLDWGYPYDYGYYYPDAGDYYYSYAPTSYAGAGTVAVVDPVITATQPLAQPAPSPSEIATTTSADAQQETDEALQFYSEARAAFLQGDYQNALRLGCHAAVESPRNSKVHELISLALFASGKYAPAAGEAHAAMALGTIAGWNDLYAYYNNADRYTTQLRALEKAVVANPKDVADRFLLGYHYLMIGARNNAKTELAEAAKLTPSDKLASHYLQELQSNAPLTPPQMASKPQGKSSL
jgi:tetratricopeptide (TPR) repeat protein